MLVATAFALLFFTIALVPDTGWESEMTRSGAAWIALFCASVFALRLLLHGYLNYRGIPYPTEQGGVLREAAVHTIKLAKKLASGR